MLQGHIMESSLSRNRVPRWNEKTFRCLASSAMRMNTFFSTEPIFNNTDFPSKFCVFNFPVKSPSITQRSGSQESAFKKSKNRRFFPSKTIGSNNSFTVIENNFRFLRTKFEFKVTVHYSLWAKCTQLWRLQCAEKKITDSFIYLGNVLQAGKCTKN